MKNVFLSRLFSKYSRGQKGKKGDEQSLQMKTALSPSLFSFPKYFFSRGICVGISNGNRARLQTTAATCRVPTHHAQFNHYAVYSTHLLPTKHPTHTHGKGPHHCPSVLRKRYFGRKASTTSLYVVMYGPPHSCTHAGTDRNTSSIVSRIDLGLPGRFKMRLCFLKPAVCLESTAVGTYRKLMARICSPYPGIMRLHTYFGVVFCGGVL